MKSLDTELRLSHITSGDLKHDTSPKVDYYARAFVGRESFQSEDYETMIRERGGLRPAVRDLLIRQMRSTHAELDTEQLVNSGDITAGLVNYGGYITDSGQTVLALYEKSCRGAASPVERIQVAQYLPFDSLELARRSYYSTPDRAGEREMQQAVMCAIVQAGGTIYDQPTFHGCKVKALDVHPVISRESGYVQYVSLDKLNSQPEAIRGAMQVATELGRVARIEDEGPIEVELDGVDYLEAMVLSIKEDIGEFSDVQTGIDESDGSKFVVRNRKKVLIEYNRLHEEVRDSLLYELKRIPVEELAKFQDDENHILAYLNNHPGLLDMLRRIVETEDTELMTDIYYAVRSKDSSQQQ